jgi:hypothetical protein
MPRRPLLTALVLACCLAAIFSLVSRRDPDARTRMQISASTSADGVAVSVDQP